MEKGSIKKLPWTWDIRENRRKSDVKGPQFLKDKCQYFLNVKFDGIHLKGILYLGFFIFSNQIIGYATYPFIGLFGTIFFIEMLKFCLLKVSN
ncbi:hypothetical protein QSE00_05575 [Arenibacter sp. M-2]|uniref:hypothetical protein n=1 Tax=Arenibacter sp. M-2 TaxID=3053612 RepID=UPI002570104D|nr:hypothetical protein [Arenibacter sp. M-2]MDL5511273.1 hypothetical protein [Arenibacter sp. M-2]